MGISTWANKLSTPPCRIPGVQKHFSCWRAGMGRGWKGQHATLASHSRCHQATARPSPCPARQGGAKNTSAKKKKTNPGAVWPPPAFLCLVLPICGRGSWARRAPGDKCWGAASRGVRAPGGRGTPEPVMPREHLGDGKIWVYIRCLHGAVSIHVHFICVHFLYTCVPAWGLYVPAGRLSCCSRTQKQGWQQWCPHSCHSLGTLGDSSQAATTPAARRASLSCTGDFQPFWGFPYGITPKHEERRHPAGASTQREGGSAAGTEVALTPPGGWERWQKIHLWEHEVNVKPFPCGVWLCQTSPCPWSARVLDTCRAQRGKYSQIQRLWDGTAPAQWKKAPTG